MRLVGRICFEIFCLSCAAVCGVTPEAELLDVKGIWSRAEHNAYSDLIRFKDRWYCTFREGRNQFSLDGAIRVLSSFDGEVWLPAALLTSPNDDLRNPKLSLTPDDRLMINAVAIRREPGGTIVHSLCWYSTYGRDWTDAVPMCSPGIVLSRLVWRRQRAYCFGGREGNASRAALYSSAIGIEFLPIPSEPFPEGNLQDGSLLFLPDHSIAALLQVSGSAARTYFGKSLPPYRAWSWKDLGVRLNSPNMLQLPDRRIAVATGLEGAAPRTLLCWLYPETGRLREFLSLPSGGETGHPGLAFHGGTLWISYHSSHEGKTRIYLARVKLLEPAAVPQRGGMHTGSYSR